MKVKPKEVLLNLPVALLFDTPQEIAAFAANVNTVLHGKVRLKMEELGSLGGRHVGLFYLQRNDEYHQIRDEFTRLIEEEEVTTHAQQTEPSKQWHNDDQCFGVAGCMCVNCDPYGGMKP